MALVDIYSKSSYGNHQYIPYPIAKQGPLLNYDATLKEVLPLLTTFPQVWVLDSATKTPITLANLFNYFPDYNPYPGSDGTQTLITTENIGDYFDDYTKNKPDLVVGKNVTGTEYTIDGTPVTAGDGAEIFNSYSGSSVNKASGAYSHAEGFSTIAAGALSHAEGYNTKTSGNYSHAEGIGTQASNESCHAEGSGSKATARSSHAEGAGTTASGDGSHSEGGGNTTASGAQSHAEGFNTTASGVQSHAEGLGTKASNDHTHAEGSGSKASGNSSHAEGSGSEASGLASHAEGGGTTASGDYSHTEGGGTTALKIYSHSEGHNSSASGDVSHAEGSGTRASGNYSHAEGMSTISSGNYSHAEGNGTSAIGDYSHAEGGGSKASGTVSHAEGNMTTASGNYSHAEGIGTKASGDYSHAEGSGTQALHNYSHTEGYCTKTAAAYQHVQGKYNATNTDYVFIIGNGTADNARSNAFAIDWNGLIYINNAGTGVNVTNLVVKESGKGLSTNDYTTEEKTKLSGIETGAEVNQNAFSNITIGSSTIAADSKTDTLTITAGTNITITPDTTNDAFTINAIDTTYDEASYDHLGLVKSGSTMKTVDDTYQPCPIVEGVPYYTTLDVPHKVERYGIKINKNDSNPETSCTYMYDAVGFTPAHMVYNDNDIEASTFSVGSWIDAFFVKNNYPVMCNYDGTEDYKLSKTDQDYKEDGETPSDISDTTYTGNAMSCFDCKIWIKKWEDDNYEYYSVSNYQLDEDYKDYPYIRADGTHADKLYYPMFKGSSVDSKLRSIAGTYPQNKTTSSQEVTLCSANGTNWQIEDWAHRTWLNVLLLLLGKNQNTQLIYGEGCTSGGADNASIHYGFPVNGSLKNKGQFYGYATAKSTTKAVKVFYIENWWGTRWDRCLGLWNDKGTYKIKWTPTYSVSAVEADALVMSGVAVPSTGWQKKMSNTYGRLCIAVGGSGTTYTCDYHYANTTQLNLALVGGRAGNGSGAGAWCVRVDVAPSNLGWSFGASPYLKQPS